MKTLMKNYELFALLLEKGLAEKNPYLDFQTVCRCLGAAPSDLDEILRDETGFGGDEILERYRVG